MQKKKLSEKERDEAVKLITAVRKLSETQRAGFQLMVEEAKPMSEKTKNGSNEPLIVFLLLHNLFNRFIEKLHQIRTHILGQR